MNQLYLKIAGVTLVLLLALYVFFPVGARQDKPGANTVSTSTVKSETAKAEQPAKTTGPASKPQTATARSKQPATGKSQPARQAKAKQIEPDDTLRKAESKSRSGPPSKMYGGL